MVTLLDCIRRVPTVLDQILAHRKENVQPLLAYLGKRVNTIDEIVMVGSGTSGYCSMTSKVFLEKTSGIQVSVQTPNEFCYDRYAYNPNALYLFTSQSGTSKVVNEGIEKMNRLGYLTAAMTESPDTVLAKKAGAHLDMGCGYEEYGMRTVGYCASVFTQMLLGMELGLIRGTLSPEEYEGYLAEAERLHQSHESICDKTLAWFDANKRALMLADNFAIAGPGSLWGVSLEGALKIMEMAWKIGMGYELEDCLHGPVFGFTGKTAFVVLGDGGREDPKIMELMDNVKKNPYIGSGFIMGKNVLDKTDLQLDLATENFACLELAPAVEILAYRLAVDSGIDLGNNIPEGVTFVDTHF